MKLACFDFGFVASMACPSFDMRLGSSLMFIEVVLMLQSWYEVEIFLLSWIGSWGWILHSVMWSQASCQCCSVMSILQNAFFLGILSMFHRHVKAK